MRAEPLLKKSDSDLTVQVQIVDFPFAYNKYCNQGLNTRIKSCNDQ
jgi:hypothetical protein